MQTHSPQISDFKDAVSYVQAQSGCTQLQAEDAITNGTSVESLGMECDSYREAHEENTSYNREA